MHDAAPRPRRALAMPLLMIATLLAASVGGARAAAPPGGTAGPIVVTRDGPLQGAAADGVGKFLAIPYAAPPVGDLRWRPPSKHAPWTAVRPATTPAPPCAMVTTLGLFSGPGNDNEDCLHLNVFTPDLRPAKPLPVIVYLHGGGNFTGEARGYDGSRLAAGGQVVVVTVDFRLNLMGFLAHPALDQQDGFGNYGILDQQAALEWVQRNIAAFGGDKDNVTLAGQSSGAIDVLINMVSPAAAGLFHRAICQSSCYATYPALSREAAEAIGVAFAEAAGCGGGTGPDTAKCLRALPASRIQALAGSASAPSKFVITTAGIVEGRTIPDQPIALLKSGRFHHVPLLTGATSDEYDFFLAITEYWSSADNALRTPPTAGQYASFVASTYGPPKHFEGVAAKVLALYPTDAFRTPAEAWSRAASDARICDMRRLTRLLASQVPVYAYEFADRAAPSYFPDMPGLRMGAYHTGDIQYVFPAWRGASDVVLAPLNGEQQALSDRIITAWAQFARSGNPNGSGNHPWPRHSATPGEPAWLIQGSPAFTRMTDHDYAALRRCDFWDAASPAP